MQKFATVLVIMFLFVSIPMMAQKAEFNEGEVKDNGKGTDDAEIFTITSDETSFDRQSILAKLDKKQLAFSADALVRKSSSSPQESSDPFENIPLARFNKAGNNLKLNMWSKFGGNLFNYLVPLVGITTEETTTTVTTTDVFGNPITVETGTEEETKVSTLGYIFSFGSIGAFIFSDYKAGQAGSDLHAIGNRIAPDFGYKLTEAGNNLRSFRTLSHVSSGLGILANILLFSSINDIANEDFDKAGTKLYSVPGALLAQFITRLIAVNHAGKAGEDIESFSNDIKTDWQKYYFAECGSDLKEFNERWDTGVGLQIGGLAVIVAGGLAGAGADEETVALVGGITGGIMVFVGKFIYNDWLAPASLGSAGTKLQDFEARMKNRER